MVELVPMLADVADIDATDHYRERHHHRPQPEAHSVGEARPGRGATDHAHEQRRQGDPRRHLVVVAHARGEGGQQHARIGSAVELAAVRRHQRPTHCHQQCEQERPQLGVLLHLHSEVKPAGLSGR